MEESCASQHSVPLQAALQRRSGSVHSCTLLTSQNNIKKIRRAPPPGPGAAAPPGARRACRRGRARCTGPCRPGSPQTRAPAAPGANVSRVEPVDVVLALGSPLSGLAQHAEASLSHMQARTLDLAKTQARCICNFFLHDALWHRQLTATQGARATWNADETRLCSAPHLQRVERLPANVQREHPARSTARTRHRRAAPRPCFGAQRHRVSKSAIHALTVPGISCKSGDTGICRSPCAASPNQGPHTPACVHKHRRNTRSPV